MEWFTPPSCLLTQKSTPLSLQIHPYKPHWGWYEVSAVCPELKCHLPRVPFRGSRRCPVTDHVHPTGWHVVLSINCMLFLTGWFGRFFINSDSIHWGSNLSVKDWWQSARQVLTNCKWQISRMLQDTLNSWGIQFYCFNFPFNSLYVKKASNLLKCHDPGLRHLGVVKMDKATTQACCFVLPSTHYILNTTEMALAWIWYKEMFLRHRASFPQFVKCFIFP